jgi:hypothetical protein
VRKRKRRRKTRTRRTMFYCPCFCCCCHHCCCRHCYCRCCCSYLRWQRGSERHREHHTERPELPLFMRE